MMDCICEMVNRKKKVLFLAKAIIRDSHHLKSSTYRKQDINLCRIWVKALLHELLQ